MEKDIFYEELERAYRRCSEYDAKIIVGNMNAKVGQEEIFRPINGKYSLHAENNDNGIRLINLAASLNMTIASTYFQHKRHKVTWYHLMAPHITK